MATTDEPILVVDDLRSQFHLRSGVLKAVDGLSFSLRPGRVLAIVGESGSGKSVTALSLLRLLDPPGRIEGGRILYRGRDLMELSEAEMERDIRGNRIAMIFQDPMTSLNPAFTIGEQIAEGIIAHRDANAAKAKELAVELLRLVGIANPEDRYDDYPHQFSGGMRQRVLIATAIACEPDVLIADEPTTALDVTIQAQILKLLSDIQRRQGNAMLLITHDLGVVAAMADEVLVMYAGHMVESGDVETVFREPRHPYTQALFASLIELDDNPDKPLQPIAGAPAIPVDLPPGCPFRPRCSHAFAPCETDYPWPRDVKPGHPVACHLVASGAANAEVG
jgi:oligopeptide transport system ATP-binding protein